MKRQLIMILFFFTFMPLFSQSTININKNGVYFIDCGIVNEIPFEYELTYPRFWKNYIVFGGAEIAGIYLYNKNNGATSDFLESGMFQNGKDNIFFDTPIDKKGGLFFNISGFEYELDPVSLRTINRITVIDKTLELFDWNKYRHYISNSFIQERVVRFINGKYYLDVIFGENIDLSKKGNWIIGAEKDTEQFLLIITEYRESRR